MNSCYLLSVVDSWDKYYHWNNWGNLEIFTPNERPYCCLIRWW